MMKEYDVFISYAQPDAVLAEKLCDLLRALDLKPFFAPAHLPKESAKDWEKGILKNGLNKSRCFLPLFTHQSLHRPWVLFEAGAAAALKMQFFIAQVHGVDDKEVNLFPYAHNFIHSKLYHEEDLKNLLINIHKTKSKSGKESESFRRKVDQVFVDRRVVVDAVTCQARRRWIFIAGNQAKATIEEDQIKSEDLKEFTQLVSTQLIEQGFNISACPQVETVGKVALETADEWTAHGRSCPITGCEVDYEIGGIYPIDQKAYKSKLMDARAKTRWQEHLLQFRKSYLSNKDWLLVIGGNEGSAEEFQAVQELNNERNFGIKVCFVTYFGGSAFKIFKKKSNENHLYFDGCQDWKKVMV